MSVGGSNCKNNSRRVIVVSVGIDVSKGKSMVCIMKPYGEVVAGPMEISHIDTELKMLVKLIKNVVMGGRGK